MALVANWPDASGAGDVKAGAYHTCVGVAPVNYIRPLRSLAEAAQVPDGTYGFDIGGQRFATHVSAGRVLLASVAAGASAMTQGDILDGEASSVMLPEAVVRAVSAEATLGEFYSPPVEASHKVTFGDDSYGMARLRAFRSLNGAQQSASAAALALNGWGGAGLADFISTCSPADGSLADVIWHGCGAFSRPHWFPNISGGASAYYATFLGASATTFEPMVLYVGAQGAQRATTGVSTTIITSTNVWQPVTHDALPATFDFALEWSDINRVWDATTMVGSGTPTTLTVTPTTPPDYRVQQANASAVQFVQFGDALYLRVTAGALTAWFQDSNNGVPATLRLTITDATT